MKKHIFTFGIMHPYSDRHQVIYAKDAETARQAMIDTYDNNWAFQYTEEEWEKSKSEGYFKKNQPIEAIYCEEEEE